MTPYDKILQLIGDTSDQSNHAHWIRAIAVAGNLPHDAAWTYPTDKPVTEFLHRLREALGPDDRALRIISIALAPAKERE